MKRWPNVTVLDLWCIVWTLAERQRLMHWVKVMPPVIPGRPVKPPR